MIKLTRFNGKELVVNAELIKFLESTPDTVVTLTTKEKILVRNSVDEIINKVIEYQRSIRKRIS
ncbi:flagellar FlbD family protein [Candidatus Aerophobetes bacterium]|nr:flagellar FlbD family protein [Candidatus Aerophobetes bacterium]